MSTVALVHRHKSQTKLTFFIVFGLLTVFVTYMKNRGVFDPTSDMAQHYEPALGFLLVHGFFGALALLLGAFQFSNRLRARYLGVHRALGYIYITSVFISVPFAIVVAMKIDTPSLVAASAAQSFGWIASTLIALYCVRNGYRSASPVDDPGLLLRHGVHGCEAYHSNPTDCRAWDYRN
jgi:hypothetical protein